MKKSTLYNAGLLLYLTTHTHTHARTHTHISKTPKQSYTSKYTHIHTTFTRSYLNKHTKIVNSFNNSPQEHLILDAMDIFVIIELDALPTLLYVMDIHHAMMNMMKVTVVSDMNIHALLLICTCNYSYSLCIIKYDCLCENRPYWHI